MPHRDPSGNPRGYFAIGVYHPKFETNIGQLWRHAWLYGAAYLFTVGARYHRQPTDTVEATRSIPLFNYANLFSMTSQAPSGCAIVAVELHDCATPLPEFEHPDRAVYVLGAEDHGLPDEWMRGRRIVSIPMPRSQSMNVATAGTVVLYDRHVKHLARVRRAALAAVSGAQSSS